MRTRALGLAATLLLTGCAAQTPPPPITQADFLDLVAELDTFDGIPEANINDLGQGVCEVREAATDASVSPQEALVGLLKVYTERGFDARDTGGFFVYATARFCPEYNDETLAG